MELTGNALASQREAVRARVVGAIDEMQGVLGELREKVESGDVGEEEAKMAGRWERAARVHSYCTGVGSWVRV